jgi:signal transduction histidine kinase
MGKLFLRSLKMTSAKQKPELELSYFQTLIEGQGVYLLLLEPITTGDTIDFKILLASQAIKDLENDHNIEGKSIRDALHSPEQWIDSCKRTLETREQVIQNIRYSLIGETVSFNVYFSRNKDMIIANWHPVNFNRVKDQVENAHQTRVENSKSASPTEQDNNHYGKVLENEKMMAQAHTIRTIIHEIRNPLTAIALANQLLIETNNDGNRGDLSLHALTTVIFQNSRRIEDHLRQLLLPKPSTENTFAPLDLCSLVDKALQKAESRLFLGRVKVCRNFKPGYMIRGDEEKLITTILNLIINAIEALSIDNGHLWISIFPVDKYVKLIIRDNGIGIEPDHLEKIFEPNFSNKQSGLGLGLANVREILEYHNAMISVTSEVGKGTSFTISFQQLPTPGKKKENPLQYKIDF